MADFELNPASLQIDVYRSGGVGAGWSVGPVVVTSAVRVTHLPTGIEAISQTERSQLRNKEIALAKLRKKLSKAAFEHVHERIEKDGAHDVRGCPRFCRAMCKFHFILKNQEASHA